MDKLRFIVIRYDSSDKPTAIEGEFTDKPELDAYLREVSFPEFLKVFMWVRNG